jgi:glutathione synthase/RimK-type ligase-like ATP-grasp enzyme
MSKKVLIITSSRSKTSDWADRERYVEEFYSSVQSLLDDTTILYTTYNDIITTVIDSQVTVVDSRHSINLKDVNVVHFKNWMFDHEHAALIAFYLKHHGVPFYNQEVNAGLAWGKISQMCRLAIGNVPVPDTFFAKAEVLKDYFKKGRLPENFVFPLILKADDGAKGNDNFLVKTAEEAVKILDEAGEDKEFVVQNYLPNNGDYRFLFAGLEQVPLVFLRKAVKGTHLNNTSQGGSGSFVDIATLPGDYLIHAKNAARILRREISGVDIIVDKKTKRPYVLEVNSTPALATGYGVKEKQKLFKRFIESHLQQEEEEE